MIKKRRNLSPEHKARLRLLDQLLDKGALKQPGAYGRELKLMKELQTQYPDAEFWKTIKPTIPLDSLVYFKGFGREYLDSEWRAWQISRADAKSAADKEWEREISRLEEELQKPLDTKDKTPSIDHKSPTKRGAIAWADSK